MAKKQLKIPFQQNGDLIGYTYGNDTAGATYWAGYNQTTNMPINLPVVWEDNFKFKDSFEYAGYSKGRSSCHIYLRSTTTNRKHFVLISDFDLLMKKIGLNDNKITWEFTFAKRGSNYMMIPVWPDDAT